MLDEKRPEPAVTPLGISCVIAFQNASIVIRDSRTVHQICLQLIKIPSKLALSRPGTTLVAISSRLQVKQPSAPPATHQYLSLGPSASLNTPNIE